MHHRPAGEVEDRDRSAQRPVEEAALAPNHVGQRKVHDRHPEPREQQVRREPDALGDRATDQAGVMMANIIWKSMNVWVRLVAA